jgi:hypothetical protein
LAHRALALGDAPLMISTAWLYVASARTRCTCGGGVRGASELPPAARGCRGRCVAAEGGARTIRSRWVSADARSRSVPS